MTTQHEPIVFYIGDTWQINSQLHGEDGEALNLAGATLEWKLAPFIEGGSLGAVAFTLTRDNGIFVSDEATGQIEITLTDEQSATLAAGYYEDQLRVTTQSGVVHTEFIGRIDVKEAIT